MDKRKKNEEKYEFLKEQIDKNEQTIREAQKVINQILLFEKIVEGK